MTDTVDRGRAFTTNYPPSLDMYAAHDDDGSVPTVADMITDPRYDRGLNAAQPAPPAGHPVERADQRLQHLIAGAEQLLGVAVAAPLRQAAAELSTAGYAWNAEAVRLADQCQRWQRFTDDLRAMIERRDAHVDAARDMAARLEEQIANSWHAHYAGSLKRTIRDLVAGMTPPGPASGDSEPTAVYDDLITQARDRAQHQLRQDARAGKVNPPPPGDTTTDDDPVRLYPAQLSARSPQFRMNRNALGVPVICDPDMPRDVLELRDQATGQTVARIRIDLEG
jgi:hypothetical protein